MADHTRDDAGFTLIETIVALAILGAALVAFYAFLSTLMNAADRIRAAANAYDRHYNALELAKTVNPMDAPEGNFDLGTYRIHWTSQLIDKIIRSSRYPAGSGIFKIALYRLTLSFPDDSGTAPIVVTKLGYHRDNLPMDPMSIAHETQ